MACIVVALEQDVLESCVPHMSAELSNTDLKSR